MKRIFKFIPVLAIAFALFGLTSCGGDKDVPEGMQLVPGCDKYGYNFYVPEEWTVSSYGNFASAYFSSLDLSSITFAEAQMPEGKTKMNESDMKEYFKSQMDKIKHLEKREMIKDGEQCDFGNERNAYKFIYTYSDPNDTSETPVKHKEMQILIERGGRLYIFQYHSQDRVPDNSSDGRTLYDKHLSRSEDESEKIKKVSDVIKEFKFLDNPPPKQTVKAGSSGEFVLVSDYKLSGFDFYAPSDSIKIASSAVLHLDLGEGASVSISEFITLSDKTEADDYWKDIFDSMAKTYQNVERINETAENTRPLKGAAQSWYYEYTYSYGGESYKGYMLFISTGTNAWNANRYILNYTAPEAEYNKNDILNKMLEKVEFK